MELNFNGVEMQRKSSAEEEHAYTFAKAMPRTAEHYRKCAVVSRANYASAMRTKEFFLEDNIRRSVTGILTDFARQANSSSKKRLTLRKNVYFCLFTTQK